MNLNLYRTYVKVVETQNLSKTAEEFGLSQPAITKQIQALEDLYGVLLLERSGRKLKTTEAGETLYQCARDILKVMDKTEQIMEEFSESRKGNLFIAGSNIPGEYILPNLIKAFKDKYPYINISMAVADTEKVFSQVAEREIDLGIVGGWINNRKVDGFQWLEDELLVVFPAEHRFAGSTEVNLHDLAQEKYIFREKGSGTRRVSEELLLAHGIKKEDINIYMEAGSTEAVLALVEAGMGISIVSKWAAERIDPHRKIKSSRIADAAIKRHFYVIYPRQKHRRKSVQHFLEFIKEID
ncbi:selenium metabolism-associated LysR family transcriptional regulator [Syntrophomonas palmitatica]|uniref:selenium metabolism-associated LysR family transcriptional regulator n=1 Tax=Syntrophomonas palmitatica TaxID=402877 RepID=UPI0006D19C40|nr:selenium metabolism-associated LysR family transcriptional regulator [Syntrophomonas palmitatica]